MPLARRVVASLLLARARGQQSGRGGRVGGASGRPRAGPYANGAARRDTGARGPKAARRPTRLNSIGLTRAPGRPLGRWTRANWFTCARHCGLNKLAPLHLGPMRRIPGAGATKNS